MSRIAKTQKTFELVGFFIGWISVVAQFILMVQNRQAEILETVIRFFSFFTILTNILVALFFTSKVFVSLGNQLVIFNKKEAATAVTTFILIVGLIYQFVLRGIWEPKGAQFLVDELLHSIIPLYFLTYWFLFSAKQKLNFGDVFGWLLYPLIYLVFVLIRGSLSNFYPYPFLNIPEIGVVKVMVNSLFILLFIIAILGILIFVNNKKINI